MNNKKLGNLCSAIGFILLLIALCAAIWTTYNNIMAGKSASNAVDVVTQEILEHLSLWEDADLPVYPDYLLNEQMDMPTIAVEELDYIGILSIHELNLELPVINDWSYPHLKKAPCRYVGSIYDNNCIIAAHNYSRHFGKINQLDIGSLLTFTDMDGNVFTYEVSEKETLGGTDVQEMISGDWDLTLFTCTLGGKTRVTVRCDLVEAPLKQA